MTDFAPYTPLISSPYPKNWSDISDFEYTSHLFLARAREALEVSGGREAQYVVAADYSCRFKVDGEPFVLTVPSGMLTDLTSVPRLGRGIVNRVGAHLEAAILHDFLFIAWQDAKLENGEPFVPTRRDFEFANLLMVRAMEAARVPRYKRWIIKTAIGSVFGRKTFFDPNPGTRYVTVPRA